MKKFLIAAFLILTYLNSNAQKLNLLDGRIRSSHAIIFVDSVKMEFNTFNVLDTTVIKSVNIVNKNSYTDTVYITLKDHNYIKNLTWAKNLSLKELTNMNIAKADRGKPIIYIMNHILLTDTTGVRIPSEKFYSVKITKATEIPYFKQTFPDALLINIETVIYVK